MANKNDLIRLYDNDGVPRTVVTKSDGIFMPDGNTTLTTKMNEVTSQLEQKANNDEVRLKKIKISEYDITETLKNIITGNAPMINSVEDNSINVNKVDFIECGKNIINYETFNDGFIIDGSYDSGLQPFLNCSASLEYIFVEPNTTYIANDSCNYAEYDNKKTFIQGANNIQNTGYKFTTSPTTRYIRVSCIKDRKKYFQIEKGEATTNYEDYTLKIDESIYKNVKIEECDFFEKPTNLFNKNNIILNKDIDSSWDNEYDNTNNCITNYYIDITQNKHLICNVTCTYGFRDVEGNPTIGGFQNVAPNTHIVVPEGAKKVRFAINKGNIDICQIEIGDSCSEYQEFIKKPYLKEEYIKLPSLFENNLKGLIGDSLGDSLTGQGFFQYYIKELFELKDFENHGIGGSRLSGANVDETKPSMWQDERINVLNSNAKFITVLGGQNDHDVQIGDITKSNMDTNTYVGALNTIIDKIYKKYNGNIEIILCTPFFVPGEGDDSGDRQHNMRDAILKLGAIQGLKVADFGGESCANKYTKDLYWGEDKIHPLESFYKDKITPILASVLKKIG